MKPCWIEDSQLLRLVSFLYPWAVGTSELSPPSSSTCTRVTWDMGIGRSNLAHCKSMIAVFHILLGFLSDQRNKTPTGIVFTTCN